MQFPLRLVGRGHTPTPQGTPRRMLLVGPHDPKGGEYTFLAPPLGVWRLAGVLGSRGIAAQVFDPNSEHDPEAALSQVLGLGRWDVVGFSTTGMTLQFDLALVHQTKALAPGSLLVAGGMEATFDPELMFRLAPFDLVVLGEGEAPLLELAGRLQSGADVRGIPGTAWQQPDGSVIKHSRPALTREEMRDAIRATPYDEMPFPWYWERLERSCRVGGLPVKAEREARLAEIRSARLITLNYCPMGCTFCSSTNFLNAAQGGATARIARLDEHETLDMVQRIVRAHPQVRTVIFQDDIFVFNQDHRILPLCELIVKAKQQGELPRDLHFISTNRIDAMTPERLEAMQRAGFRVLGFGIESFSLEILREFNKAQIHPFIEPVLDKALRLGITPFLDMILTSPRCRAADLAENVRQAYRWVAAGCEVGMYPYVIPFSGAAMARDSSLRPHTVFARRHIRGTDIEWDQPCKLLPIDPLVRDLILRIEADFETRIAVLDDQRHVPSRIRSLLWVVSAIPLLRDAGFAMPPATGAARSLIARLPGLSECQVRGLRQPRQARTRGARRKVRMAGARRGAL
jgi:radical SAM superfamily enzyme YgiQ (UPF0313 family)